MDWAEIRDQWIAKSSEIISDHALNIAGIYDGTGYENGLVEAIVAVFDLAASAPKLIIQRALLSAFDERVQDFYTNRALKAFKTPSGKLCPDLVLYYTGDDAGPDIPTWFLIEAKWKADFNTPLAKNLLFETPCINWKTGARWDKDLILCLTHFTDGLIREPHAWTLDCFPFWHYAKPSNGLWRTGAHQLDCYIAYMPFWIKQCGCPLDRRCNDRPPVMGIVVDAMQRPLSGYLVTRDYWVSISWVVLIEPALKAWKLESDNAYSFPPDLRQSSTGLLLGRLLWEPPIVSDPPELVVPFGEAESPE